MNYTVIVSRPGFGSYQGGTYDTVRYFRDERKSRDFYTDMLVKYPDAEVKLERQ